MHIYNKHFTTHSSHRVPEMVSLYGPPCIVEYVANN